MVRLLGVLVLTAALAAATAFVSYQATHSWASTYGGPGPFVVIALLAGPVAGILVYGIWQRFRLEGPRARSTFMLIGLAFAVATAGVGTVVGNRERAEWLEPMIAGAAAVCEGNVGRDLLEIANASGPVLPHGPNDQPVLGESSGVSGGDYPEFWCVAHVQADASAVETAVDALGWAVIRSVADSQISGLGTRYRSSAGVVVESVPADPVEGLGCTEWQDQDEGGICVASQPVVRLFAWIP